MLKSDQLNELAAALVIAQSQLRAAPKQSKNPFFNSSYADLGSVWNVCKKPLADNGLTIIQTCDRSPDKSVLILETTLLHKSGQFITGTMTMPMDKQTPQAMGSAMSYAKRYSLAAMVGVVTAEEDDDAESATSRGETDLPDRAKLQEAVAVLKTKCGHLSESTKDEYVKTIFKVTKAQLLAGEISNQLLMAGLVRIAEGDKL